MTKIFWDELIEELKKRDKDTANGNATFMSVETFNARLQILWNDLRSKRSWCLLEDIKNTSIYSESIPPVIADNFNASLDSTIQKLQLQPTSYFNKSKNTGVSDYKNFLF